MCLAVALDDEPSVDEQIDESHALDPHLQFRPDSERSKHEPNERLGAGFRSLIQERSQPPVSAGQSSEHLCKTSFVDDTKMQHAVQSGDRRPRTLALNGLHERFDDGREHGVFCRG